jgi:hypothetical protein
MRTRVISVVVLVVVASLLWAGCGGLADLGGRFALLGDGGGDGEGGGGPPLDAALPYDSGAPDAFDASQGDVIYPIDGNCPSFAANIWPLLTTKWGCGAAGPCHSSADSGYKPILNDLSTPAAAYNTLNTSKPRLLAPGANKTSSSLLYCVISGPSCGPPMPNAAGASADDQLTVEEWVWCGQPNN